jgi:hypothetical protein
MWWDVACDALRAGKCLSITYDGYTRLVEVHAVGTTKDGNPVLRAWQRHSTKPGFVPQFRLFRLDHAWTFAVSNELSQAPRRGYKRDDSHIAVIRCQI